MENQPDAYVMRLVQQGDAAQMAVLFERYHASLFRYLLHLTAERDRSEDLVQEVFFRALKYASTFDPEHSFPVWLYQMARNAHFDSLRKRRPAVPEDAIAEFRCPEPQPEELFTRKQDLADLERALAALPQEKREVLVLSRFHNLRYEEIARVLNCQTGAVKVRVHRALKDLRETFRELRGEKIT